MRIFLSYEILTHLRIIIKIHCINYQKQLKSRDLNSEHSPNQVLLKI